VRLRQRAATCHGLGLQPAGWLWDTLWQEILLWDSPVIVHTDPSQNYCRNMELEAILCIEIRGYYHCAVVYYSAFDWAESNRRSGLWLRVNVIISPGRTDARLYYQSSPGEFYYQSTQTDTKLYYHARSLTWMNSWLSASVLADSYRE